ncbi:hypothetical protein LTR94_036015, partial [Friedmanniomyces endolithicus]
MSQEDRMNALREYFPNAKDGDWRLWQAGQRVQIIKRDPKNGAVLQFGTEIVTDKDGTIAALQVLAALVSSGKPASELLHLFDPVPQLLKNVRFAGGKPLEADT